MFGTPWANAAGAYVAAAHTPAMVCAAFEKLAGFCAHGVARVNNAHNAGDGFCSQVLCYDCRIAGARCRTRSAGAARAGIAVGSSRVAPP